ncbi:hypothetical protein BC830DRAFT_339534 [Chytriomyces sp. MP71]|nr:hypothetical protein BC830DRAFT_339534 [Chytriomyces sp. MP71]
MHRFGRGAALPASPWSPLARRSFTRKAAMGKVVQQRLRSQRDQLAGVPRPRATPRSGPSGPSPVPVSPSAPPTLFPSPVHALNLPAEPTQTPVETAEGRHPESQVSLAHNPRPMPAPESVASGGHRIEWFSDPFLLSDRIHTLLQHGGGHRLYIENLVMRHKGAANTQVFGTLIAGMAKVDSVLALKFFREMKARGLTPTPQTYTVVLMMYSKQVNAALTSSDLVKAHLADALNVWDEVKQSGLASTIHLNSILTVCSTASKFGGLQRAMEIYKEAIDNSAESKPFDVDIVTFTIMIRLLSSSRKDPTTILETDFVNSGLRPDEALVNAVLIYLNSTRITNDRRRLRAYAAAAFNLPLAPTTKATYISTPILDLLEANRDHMELSSQTLDVILRSVLKSRQPLTVLAVSDHLLAHKRANLVDEGVARTIVQAYVESGRLEDGAAFLHAIAHPLTRFTHARGRTGFTVADELWTTLAAAAVPLISPFDSKAWTKRTLDLVASSSAHPDAQPASSGPLDRVVMRTAANVALVLGHAGQLPEVKIAGARFAALWAPYLVQCFGRGKQKQVSGRGNVNFVTWMIQLAAGSLKGAIQAGEAAVREHFGRRTIPTRSRLKDKGVVVDEVEALKLAHACPDFVCVEELDEWRASGLMFSRILVKLEAKPEVASTQKEL